MTVGVVSQGTHYNVTKPQLSCLWLRTCIKFKELALGSHSNEVVCAVHHQPSAFNWIFYRHSQYSVVLCILLTTMHLIKIINYYADFFSAIHSCIFKSSVKYTLNILIMIPGECFMRAAIEHRQSLWQSIHYNWNIAYAPSFNGYCLKNDKLQMWWNINDF